jgi:hypothetical protein
MIRIAKCQAIFCISAPRYLASESRLMRIAIAVVILVAGGPAVAQGAFTDFKDYTQTVAFAAGDVFTSKDLSFKAVQRLAISNSVEVVANSNDGFLYPGPGVEFLLPSGIQEVSFRYVDGSASRIAINGVEPATYPGQGGTSDHSGFSFLNGTMLGGVEATTVLTVDGGTIEHGTLTLRGPIGSLMIAGLELSIDDVTVLVPEPNSVVLMLTSAALMTASRPRRRI